MWHFEERGQGRPLVLLHGIGMSSLAWSPVMARLSQGRRVLAFDAAGLGKTPPLPAGVAPGLLMAVDGLLMSQVADTPATRSAPLNARHC